jgi:pimeloyl-ACP methyl ester carboxylesterase
LLLPLDDRGTGPAVVLLHAGITDRTMWTTQMRSLADAGYWAIAPDFPGFGKAPRASTAAPWADLLETLDECAVGEAVVVGCSFGGAVALRLAAIAPERVTALALISAPAPGLEPSEELSQAWEAEESALEHGDIDAAVRAVVDAWLLADAPSELRDEVAGMQRRAFELQLAGSSPDEIDDPVEQHPDCLSRLLMPALVAVGEFDMADFRDGAQRLAGELPNSRHVVIEGARHLAPLEQPAAFEALLRTFLADLTSRA